MSNKTNDLNDFDFSTGYRPENDGPTIMAPVYSTKSYREFRDGYYAAAAKRGVEVFEYDFENSCCGYGTVILMADGLRTFITREVYLNEWSSGQTLRGYNKTPKKFLDAIECWYAGDCEKGLKILQ